MFHSLRPYYQHMALLLVKVGTGKGKGFFIDRRGVSDEYEMGPSVLNLNPHVVSLVKKRDPGSLPN